MNRNNNYNGHIYYDQQQEGRNVGFQPPVMLPPLRPRERRDSLSLEMISRLNNPRQPQHPQQYERSIPINPISSTTSVSAGSQQRSGISGSSASNIANMATVSTTAYTTSVSEAKRKRPQATTNQSAADKRQCNSGGTQITERAESPSAQGTLMCSKCEMKFFSPGSYGLHKLHSLEKPLKCEKCNLKFCLDSHYDTHMLTYHKDDKPRYKCKQCEVQGKEKRYHLGYKYKEHLKLHEVDSSSRQCSFCDKIFGDIKYKYKHEAKSEKQKCDHCEKRFCTVYLFRCHPCPGRKPT